MSEEIHDLLARLRAATGADRALDYDIAAAVGWPDSPLAHQNARRYTESIDAALTLVPEGFGVEMRQSHTGNRTTARAWDGNGFWSPTAVAPTPALALCIAALEARRANEGGGA